MSRKKRKLKALRAKEQQSKSPLSARRLTQGLIFSGALNIALGTSLIFYAVKSKDSELQPPYVSSSQTTLSLDLSREISLQKTLEEYFECDFEFLMGLLRDNQKIEEGVSKRDLALSILASKYDFDVERALLGQEVKTKTLSLDQKEESIPLYCGLLDSQYRLILSFLDTEQWPYTSEGLFNRIAEGQNEESLKEAFFLTKEFMLLEALYFPANFNQEDLLQLVKEGPWEIVQKFVRSKPLVQNFSNPLRVQFLCQYLEFASPTAAQMILKADPEYALNTLSDEKIVTILGLLEHKSELSENFTLHLALGTRSAWVKQEACRMLYHYCGKDFKNPFNYQEALEFIAAEYELAPSAELIQEASPREFEEFNVSPPYVGQSVQKEPDSIQKIYTVQKGDCLSKIAKKHRIEIRELKTANHLQNDLIKVGMELVIP